jgi:hypothetical protein
MPSLRASFAIAATVIFRPEYFLPETRRTRLQRVIGALFGVFFASLAAAQQIALTIDRIEGPSIAASGIKAVLRAGTMSQIELQIADISIAGRAWKNVRLNCAELRRERDELDCAQAVLEAPIKIPLSFRYSTLTKRFDITLKPAANEEWRLTLESGAPIPVLTVAMRNAQLSRINPWRPPAWPQINSGTVNGSLVLSNASANANANAGAAKAELVIADFGFADTEGLHAGEKISAAVTADAERRGESWGWHGRVEWKSGDVFWQPLFASGNGHVVEASGVMDARRVSIDRGALLLTDMGNIGFSAGYDRLAEKFSTAEVKAAGIDVAVLYAKILQPTLQGTVLGDLRCDGHLDIGLTVRDGAVVAADLSFRRVSVEDKSRRFGLFGVDGVLPWRNDAATSATLRFSGGEVLQLPFGAFELPLAMQGLRVRAPQVQIPVLDGKLVISDFDADVGRGDWRFRGGIAPVSMQQLTTGLGLPVMHGTLSAVIPTVSYQRSTLKVDGALLFKVFDGTVVVQNLALENPLGQVPRLTADLDMRNLDLDLLTRAFSFGSITGRADAQVKALELVNWEPVHFDARIRSSAGDYPRRISQAAVQNISSLGGAGAGAAIERSFLRFFDHFGYSALGLSCKLEHGVCAMSGVENVAQGYVIVKGGGIPAISVLGYNRSVGWNELITRLKRVIQDNVSPIVK